MLLLRLATIFMTVCQYGIPHTGPWLLHTMEVLFWVYVTVCIVVSAAMYLILWSTLCATPPMSESAVLPQPD